VILLQELEAEEERIWQEKMEEAEKRAVEDREQYRQIRLVWRRLLENATDLTN
jgi:hypothetical protein